MVLNTCTCVGTVNSSKNCHILWSFNYSTVSVPNGKVVHVSINRGGAESNPLPCPTVREQLSTTDSQANGRILDLKTGTVKKEGSQSAMRLCMGSRRGFICRLKVGNTSYHTQMPSPWSTPDIGDVVAGSDSLHRYAVARVDSRYRDAVAGSTPDIGMPSPGVISTLCQIIYLHAVRKVGRYRTPYSMCVFFTSLF